ncbi:hypothetical protein ES703_69793 [subsurface metagenome]
MAKVQSPLMSLLASGSIGGMVYSVWRGINTVRVKQQPVERHLPGQPRNRALLGYLSRAWGLLTDNQRQLWRDYATEHKYPDGFGGVFTLTGSQMYNALNHNAIRTKGGLFEQDEPPMIDPAASIALFDAVTGVTNPGEVDLSWDHIGVADSDDLNEIWISPPLGSEGKVNVDSRMRFEVSIGGDELLITVAGLVEGAWYWFKARYIDQFGQKTAWLWGHATPMLTP